MKKIVIPAVLAAVMVIGLAVAAMPVQKASTVHTTILANTSEEVKITGAITRSAAAETMTIDCDTDFTITSITLDGALDDAGDNLDIATPGLSIDGTAIAAEAVTNIEAAAGAVDGDLAVYLRADPAPAANSGNLNLPITALGAGAADVVFTTAGAAAGADDVITFIVGITTTSSGVCTAVGT
jgi:hypothetical protein